MQLHLADYGYREWLSADFLRPITREHMKIPWSTQKCHLVDVCPTLGDAWSQDACETLLSLVCEKTCYIASKVTSAWDSHKFCPFDFLNHVLKSYLRPLKLNKMLFNFKGRK